MNKYYKVQKDHEVEAHGGSVATNSSYGSSRIYKQKRDKITAKKGDEIHDLVGGRFLVKKGKTTHELHNKMHKDPFENGAARISVSKEHTEEISKESKAKVNYNDVRGMDKNEKKYTPLEVIQELVKSLKKALSDKNTKNRKAAKKLIADLDDPNDIAEVNIDTLPVSEEAVLDKGALDLDNASKKSIKRNAEKDNKPKLKIAGINDKKPVSRKRYEKTTIKPNLPKSEEMAKSNYGPKGMKQYKQADNAKRKAKNVGEQELGMQGIKVKSGSNASGGQGKTALATENRKISAKNKKQPVTSLKDMSPEKQAEMNALYGTKKTEKLKILLDKVRKNRK